MAKTVTLSVKNVPHDLARRLRERASRNHRSLQGELRAILEDAGQITTLDDLAALAKRLGIKGKPGESVRLIREDRDDPRR
jgi:plasmid stability protein